MKKIILLMMLVLIGINTKAQNDYSDSKYSYHFDAALEKKLLKEGNKAFINGNNDNAAIYAKEIVGKWGYWHTTKDKNNADFIIHIVSNGGFGAFMCYAVFIDPATNKVFYKTPLVNTFARVTFQAKKAVVKKLFRKVRAHIDNIE